MNEANEDGGLVSEEGEAKFMEKKSRIPELITYSDEEMDRKIKEARHGLTPEQTHKMWMQEAEKWMTEQAEKKKVQQEARNP